MAILLVGWGAKYPWTVSCQVSEVQYFPYSEHKILYSAQNS